MDYHSSKHKELSEQLTSWWSAQADFKTKRELADALKVHPDTLGDYFSGRKFPKPDIANRLCELTNIACLEPRSGPNLLSGKTLQESSIILPLPPAADITSSIEKLPERDVAGPSEEGFHSGEIPKVMVGKTRRESPKKGERYEEISIVISLQRTNCPFCAHDIDRFRGCVYCGQHFAWASVPIE